MQLQSVGITVFTGRFFVGIRLDLSYLRISQHKALPSICWYKSVGIVSYQQKYQQYTNDCKGWIVVDKATKKA